MSTRIDRRAEVLRELEAHKPADAAERESLETVLTFVRSHEDPFPRAHLDAHVTASGFVVNSKTCETLMVWHTKLERWLQPGGHVEPDDPGAYEASMREAFEETGYEVGASALGRAILDVDVHRIPERKTEPSHLHLDIRYLFEAGARVREGDHKVRWVTRAEVSGLGLDHAATRALDKVFDLLKCK